jgi:hypothetical protein
MTLLRKIQDGQPAMTEAYSGVGIEPLAVIVRPSVG